MTDENLPIILGIDPGTRVTGYGIIQGTRHSMKPIDFGCIRPPSGLKLSQRYAIIFRAVSDLIERFQPIAVSVETQFVQKNVQSAMKLGMARGVATLAAALKNIPVFEYAPRKAKKAVVGNGGASKEQVQEMLQRLLSLSVRPEPEDAADALALAICHLQSMDNALLQGTEV